MMVVLLLLLLLGGVLDLVVAPLALTALRVAVDAAVPGLIPGCWADADAATSSSILGSQCLRTELVAGSGLGIQQLGFLVRWN